MLPGRPPILIDREILIFTRSPHSICAFFFNNDMYTRFNWGESEEGSMKNAARALTVDIPFASIVLDVQG